MGNQVKLTAADGFSLGGYRADPRGQAKGGVVVIQEIFGVNHHIRSVCDRVAEAGYRAIAPALFDRIAPNFESGYSDAEVAKAREFIAKSDWAKIALDTGSAIEALKKEGPTAILGFCLGGTVTFLASTQPNGLKAAVCYYGGMIAKHADKKPLCPVQMHFGEKDGHIPLSDVEAIKQKRPECEIHVYSGAGHGFHCDERASYEPKSAKIAWERSLAFLARH
jgi:carboxymethylenebutenolidase